MCFHYTTAGKSECGREQRRKDAGDKVIRESVNDRESWDRLTWDTKVRESSVLREQL